ncbi:hypothetical protein SAMN04487995_2153 [Dyadobacter koreensis]|uniref:Uncharacterized protein n=1 Tax=Dyadobacter koreensis TaxID=408657 RepID=A0A1H6TMZ2_9BACT|nr:hypothetical protein SAMN04487995_2153 [Dyadobacter koreensis]
MDGSEIFSFLILLIGTYKECSIPKGNEHSLYVPKNYFFFFFPLAAGVAGSFACISAIAFSI